MMRPNDGSTRAGILIVSVLLIFLAARAPSVLRPVYANPIHSSGSARVLQTPLNITHARYRVGVAGPNGTVVDTRTIPLPRNVDSPYLPTLMLANATLRARAMQTGFVDPPTACTSFIGTYCTTDGVYYQAAYGYAALNGSYCSGNNCPYYLNVNIGFVGTNPSVLSSGKWISGGLAVSEPTSVEYLDLGYELFAYVDSSGNLGVAWYVVATCEAGPGSCFYNGQSIYFTVIRSNSAVIGGANYATDHLDLVVYWNNALKGMVIDYRDANISPYYYTLDVLYQPSILPAYAYDDFYFGVLNACCNLNPPYHESYGYQVGFSSNQQPISSSSWLIEISNPGYIMINGQGFTAQHAQTIGGPACQGCNGGDAYWHVNWVWGGYQPWTDYATPVEVTPIDSLTASQVNSQEFTATTSYRTICVLVTNYNGIRSTADSVGQGAQPIGAWISSHPWADGYYWNVISQSSCPYMTWVYASGYAIPDNTLLW